MCDSIEYKQRLLAMIVLVILYATTNLLAQENMTIRINRYKTGNYVEHISRNNFRIMGDNVNIIDLSEACSKQAKACIPPNHTDSLRYSFSYTYASSPVDTTLTIKALNNLYTVEYEGDQAWITYFKDDIMHLYSYKRIVYKWEIINVQTYKMKKNASGMIDLFHHLNPKQINAKIQTLLLFGYTMTSARKRVEKQLSSEIPIKSVGLVHISKKNHVVLFATQLTSLSSTRNQYWKVTLGIKDIPSMSSIHWD